MYIKQERYLKYGWQGYDRLSIIYIFFHLNHLGPYTGLYQLKSEFSASSIGSSSNVSKTEVKSDVQNEMDVEDDDDDDDDLPEWFLMNKLWTKL